VGAPESVQVSPFPTAVDRSLRIARHSDGSADAACVAVDRGATAIGLDLFADQPGGVAISLRAPDTGREIGIAVTSDGSVVTHPRGRAVAGISVEASQWLRITLALDARTDEMGVAIVERDVANLAEIDRAPLGEWRASGQAAELCIAGPQVPEADAFIDNLVIE
jgi:hypothetical protein